MAAAAEMPLGMALAMAMWGMAVDVHVAMEMAVLRNTLPEWQLGGPMQFRVLVGLVCIFVFVRAPSRTQTNW